MGAMPADRSYVGRYFALVLDQNKKYKAAGLLKTVDGMGIKGELIAQQIGGQPHRVKHINNPAIDPVTAQVGMSMSDDFWQWVANSWNGKHERRNGSIITYDFKLNPVHEYSFTNALILEHQIPTLDSASKEGAYFTVKFQAEEASHKLNPSGGRASSEAVAPAEQKLWHPSNFSFTLGGLEADCKFVAKIDSFTLKQNVKPMACGPDWMYQLEPTSLEVPNIAIYLPMAKAENFLKWHEDYVVKGNNGPEKEKNGAIAFLDPTRTKTLLTIELKRVGMHNCSAEKIDVGQDQIRRLKVELFVEEMTFKYGS
jgi:phage tail-like protein